MRWIASATGSALARTCKAVRKALLHKGDGGEWHRDCRRTLRDLVMERTPLPTSSYDDRTYALTPRVSLVLMRRTDGCLCAQMIVRRADDHRDGEGETFWTALGASGAFRRASPTTLRTLTRWTWRARNVFANYVTNSLTVEYGVRRMGTVVASAHQPGGRLVHHIVSCTPLRVDEKARSAEKRFALMRRVMVCVALAAYGNSAFRAVQRLSSYDG